MSTDFNKNSMQINFSCRLLVQSEIKTDFKIKPGTINQAMLDLCDLLHINNPFHFTEDIFLALLSFTATPENV